MRKSIVQKILTTTLMGSMVLSTVCGDNVIFPEGVSNAKAAEKVTISVDSAERSTFNDMDGNGYGEFQGFGTSLCWWANRVGYSDALTEQATEAFYNKDTGLGMTIGRYNIGGGDAPDHDHITRSDSKVPGYAVDPTRITTEEEGKNFDQYDMTAGYAWNYDWDADKNQLNVLMKAAQKAGEDFLGEAFSNSPPYFMTYSGCSSGGEGGAENLRSDCYEAFSKYLVDVTKHLKKEGYSLSSLEPMNEPASGWPALSAKQEGCRITPDSISVLLPALRTTMDQGGLNDMILAGCDYSNTTETKSVYDKIDDTAKSLLDRMDIHCYSYSKKSGAYTKETAEKEGKNLWMSEVDGSYAEGSKAGEMAAALGLAKNMTSQINYLMPSAWVLWDAIDIHVDADNKYDADSKSAEDYKNLDKNGFWGIAVADHNEGKVILTKKYYGMGQYSRYIRPGYTLLGSASSSATKVYSVAAFDASSGETVVVATNLSGQAQETQIDLSKIDFSTVDKTRFSGSFAGSSMEVIRTSGNLEGGENWADVTLETKDDSTELLNAWDASAGMINTYLKANSITTFVVRSGKPGDVLPEVSVAPATEVPAVSAAPAEASASPVPVTPVVSSAPTEDTKAPAATNPCKSIKAAKKAVTIKKNKSQVLTFYVTNAISSGKTTDKIKVAASGKKVVKIIKTANKAKRINVKVKGMKKGKSVITVKAGKVSAKMTVKVKC